MVAASAHHRFGGLDVNSNLLATNPYKELGAGARSAAIIADNIDIIGAGKVGNRRGLDYFTATTSSMVTAFFEYQSNIVQHQNGDTSLWHGDNSSGTRTQYAGNYTQPSGYRMDATVSRGSLFFTTTNGPYKLDAITHTPARSGLTKGLDTRAVTTGTGAGFMNGFAKVGYHITWIRTDANKQAVRSDVSSKVVVTNNTRVIVSSITRVGAVATVTTAAPHNFTSGDTILIAGATGIQYNGAFVITSTGASTFTYTVSGTPTTPDPSVTMTAERQMNVSLTFTAPFDALVTDNYEVWRTITKDAGTADPGDDCFLVVSAVFGGTPGAIVTYTDSTVDSTLLSATPLYTNATQEGALNGNARPPFCSAVTTYKDYTVYANTSLDHQYTVNLLSVTGLTAATSTFILSGGGTRTYVCNAAENIATQTFQLYNAGAVSANVAQTMQSLVRVINGDTGGFWYAEYTSQNNPNNNPGIIRIWARNPTSGSFAITADSNTTGGQFNPVLPTSGTTISSSNDTRPNRFFFSKFQAPDHVPLLNFIDVGKLDQPIQRVISSRDALYIIKTDGIWFISGFTLPNTPVELDSTCHIIAPASAAAVNNQIYMLSNQGIVQVSTSGVTVISFDIEPLITPLLSLTNLATLTFGVAHESERKYICWVPMLNGDTYCSQAFVFHTFLQQFTRWTKPASAGIALNSNYKLYISSGIEIAVLQQRKSGILNDVTDYSDEALAISITAQTGMALTVTWSNANFLPTAGLTIHQAALFSKVTSVKLISGSSWTFNIDRSTVYSVAAATARLPIYAHDRNAPDTCGDSGVVKTFYSASTILESNSVSQATIEVGTNEGPTLNTYTITRIVSGGWGTNPWGATGWGDATSPVASVPWSVDVPIPDCTGETLTIGWIHNVSQEPFILSQATIFYDNNSPYDQTQ